MYDGSYKSVVTGKHKRAAFTLIELLVVIAIIALLLSILAPSLGRAQELVRDTVCSSNQRHVANAIFLYAADNEGWLPYTAEPADGAVPAGENEAMNWIERISVVENADYGDPSVVNVDFRRQVMQSGAVIYKRGNFREGIFKCPTAYRQISPKDLSAGKWDFNFGANMWVLGIRRFAGGTWTWRYGNLSKCSPIEQFSNDLILLSDGNLGWSSSSGGIYFQYKTSFGYKPWPEQITTGPIGPIVIEASGHTNGRTNYTYLDGHVDLRKDVPEEAFRYW